ncbi:hypothetical protein WJX73_007651 [Symbiochloris irregularis]|uniref:DDT domain-containing protein n=1 Tax=Symbiochloris irregularis TaxID=706552 RepID=A0AAW1NN92_9CHLO
MDDGTNFSDADGGPQISDSSDDSMHPGRSRKRKRRSVRGLFKHPTPPMNDMRVKLRSAAPVEAPSDPAAHDDTSVLAQAFQRVVSNEEEQAQLAALRRDYHMATILDFFATFRYAAGLAACEFEAEALESALVNSYGEGPGLLADIHMVLLKGISPRSDVHARNWTVVLADRLKRGCYGTGHTPPFAPQRYHEAEGYAALPTPDRVLALNLLCDLRLDREDLRIGIEESLKAPPKPPKAPKTTPPPLPKEQPTRSSTRSTRYAAPPAPAAMERPVPQPLPQKGEILRLPMRKEPLGVDASGSTYWLIEMACPLEIRLYRELSLGHVSAKKAAPKGKGSLAHSPPAPSFDLLGSTSEELQAVGERLTRSKRKPDQRVAAQILDGVVPAMAAAAAEELRQAKAAERLRNQLGVILDSDGGYGRPKRSRKEVNYSYDAYDDIIRKAIRGRPSPELEQRGRSNHAHLMPAEPSRPGLRRGRSAANAEPPEASASPAPPTRASSPSQEGIQAIQGSNGGDVEISE